MTSLGIGSCALDSERGIGNVDALDYEMEQELPFRIRDPASLMEASDDAEEDDEEYDEEAEIQYYSSVIVEDDDNATAIVNPTNNSQSQQQQTQQKPPHVRQRKQQIQSLIREDADDSQIILSVEEYADKELIIKSTKKGKDKLYMLNPDDYPEDQFKQHQIRRAKVTHDHHRKKSREIETLQDENKKLKGMYEEMKLMNLRYEEREKQLRQLCKCKEVANFLSKGLRESGTTMKTTMPCNGARRSLNLNFLQRPDVKLNKQSEANKLPQVSSTSATLELKSQLEQSPSIPRTYSRQYHDSKLPKGGNVARSSPTTIITTFPSQLGPTSSDSVTTSMTNAANSQLITTKCIPSPTLSHPIASPLQVPPPSNAGSIGNSKVLKPILRKPTTPHVPPSHSTIGPTGNEGPSFTLFGRPSMLDRKMSKPTQLSDPRKNLLIAHKRPNGTRLVQIPSSALSTFAGMYGSTGKQIDKITQPSSKILHRRIIKKETSPLSRFHNTLKAINNILTRMQIKQNSCVKINPAENQLDIEATDEILKYYSNELVPLPVQDPGSNKNSNVTKPEISPSSKIDLYQNEGNISQRRSKRAAAASRLSTAELLGTPPPRKVSKTSPPEPTGSPSDDDNDKNWLDNLDYKNIELQYRRPNQEPIVC